MKTYRGSCHCGRVKFEVTADITSVADCNCSMCGRKGALYYDVTKDRFKLLSGEDDLSVYTFNVAKNYFCRHCGCHPFTHPRAEPEDWCVNVRCLEDFDLSGVEIIPFDGRNWEEANRTFEYR